MSLSSYQRVNIICSGTGDLKYAAEFTSAVLENYNHDGTLSVIYSFRLWLHDIPGYTLYTLRYKEETANPMELLSSSWITNVYD